MSQYIHHVPGRIRVRSKAFRCSAEKASRARDELLSLAGVRTVEINPRAASIIVQYDPEQLTRSQLFATLEQLGCLASATRDGEQSRRLGEMFGKALVGAVMQKAVEHSARTLVAVLV